MNTSTASPRTRLAILLLLCAATLLPAAAKVRWLNGTTHDFGAFKEDDGKVTCQYRFVNDGTEAVSIRAARASCGCTTSSFTKTPIEPGDTGVVTAVFNPTGRPGRFTKTITMDISGQGAGPRTTLTLKGVVIGSSNTLLSRYPVEAGPLKLRTTMVPFGSVLTGRAKSAFVEVYNASEQPITPTWSALPSYLKLSTSTQAIPPGEQAVYSLVLTPDDTALYGILTDSVTIAANDAQVKLDITAILEEDFTLLTPGQRQKAPVVHIPADRVDFGEFPANGTQTRSFYVENKGKSDLLVRRVYTTDPGVTVTPSTTRIRKGKEQQFMVTVDPSLLPASLLNARIQVITNDPEQPLSIIRLTGIPK